MSKGQGAQIRIHMYPCRQLLTYLNDSFNKLSLGISLFLDLYRSRNFSYTECWLSEVGNFFCYLVDGRPYIFRVGSKVVIGLVRLESLKPGFVDSRLESLSLDSRIFLWGTLHCNNLAVGQEHILLYR